MYHIFLSHSLVDGHLGCFQILTMTNNASMNLVEYMTEHHLGIYPKVVFLGLEKGYLILSVNLCIAT